MHLPEELDCYLVLGIRDDASERDIRNVYKKVALETYPDKQGGDGEPMKKVRTWLSITLALSLLTLFEGERSL
jgi:curved DNA-binding protein CbpA